MKKLKVALGLSGGVDSAVSAYLLKKQGFDVSGVYLHCFDEDAPGCRGKQDRKDAVKVALHLKIPFQVLDFRRQYKAAVIGYFKKEYLSGRTPNPDVVCNRDIKFGLLLDWCIKNGFDYLATGHYARLVPRQFLLTQPKDLHKDQTYFLWAVPRQKFSRVLFPLADFTKKDTRSLAKFREIPVADKPDSTGICFIGEVRVEDFLKRLGVKEKVGEVVTAAGQVVGRHKGVAFYTIGQRHGFEINRWPPSSSRAQSRDPASGASDPNIASLDSSIPLRSTRNDEIPPDRPPLYVIAKDLRRNRLVVGFGAECYRDQFEVADCNWLISEKDSPSKTVLGRTVLCRIRHGGELIPCSIDSPLSVHSSRFTVHLREAQRGVAAGQSAVFYLKNGTVLGGGIIQ